MSCSQKRRKLPNIRTLSFIFLFLSACFMLGLVLGTTLGKFSERAFFSRFQETSSEMLLSSMEEVLDEAGEYPSTINGDLEKPNKKALSFRDWFETGRNMLFNLLKSQSKEDKMGRYSADATKKLSIKSSSEPKYIPGESNLAIFIQVSQSSTHRMLNLLEALHHPKNIYAIHLDKKIPYLLRQKLIKQVYAKPQYKENVHFMESEPVTYRGISMVLNTIEAMNFLLKLDSSWDYFINLSGSDYPLLHASSIRMLFGLLPTNKLNFIELYPEIEWSDQATRFRIETVHFDPALEFNDELAKSESLISFGFDHPFRKRRNFTYVKSDFWGIFSREFSEFVVRESFARRMLAAFAVSDTSDEAYFATTAYNHPYFHSTIVSEAFRAVYFCHKDMNPACNGQHPFTMDENGNEDIFWKTLLRSRAIFARKFSKNSSILMNRIDNLRNGRFMMNDGKQNERPLATGEEIVRQNLTELYETAVQCRFANSVSPVLHQMGYDQRVSTMQKVNAVSTLCQEWKEYPLESELSFVSLSNFFDTLNTVYYF
eukprot:jgi/Galph1/3953/GphlegSOOS_G2638.1